MVFNFRVISGGIIYLHQLLTTSSFRQPINNRVEAMNCRSILLLHLFLLSHHNCLQNNYGQPASLPGLQPGFDVNQLESYLSPGVLPDGWHLSDLPNLRNQLPYGTQSIFSLSLPDFESAVRRAVDEVLLQFDTYTAVPVAENVQYEYYQRTTSAPHPPPSAQESLSRPVLTEDNIKKYKEEHRTSPNVQYAGIAM